MIDLNDRIKITAQHWMKSERMSGIPFSTNSVSTSAPNMTARKK